MKSNLLKTCKQIGHNWGLYLLLLPSFLLLLIFAYKPMYGVIIAFKDYKNSLGITGSPWADPLFKYFLRFFKSFQFSTTIRNTLALNLYSLLVSFPIPIFLALMINQISAKRFRKGFQPILYLPHFISTVVMVGLLLIWLSPSRGLLGAFYGLFGKTASNIMGMPGAFRSIYVWSCGSTPGGTPSCSSPRFPPSTPRCMRPLWSTAQPAGKSRFTSTCRFCFPPPASC